MHPKLPSDVPMESTTGLPPRPGGWRVGDVVVVCDRDRVTNLGEGVVVELELGPGGWPLEALIRFDDGPGRGVWYSVSTLTRLRDLEGNALTPNGLYACGRFDSETERAFDPPSRKEPLGPPEGPTQADLPSLPDELLMGRHLIALGMKSGPALGELLERAFEAQLRGAFEDLDGALAWVRDEFDATAGEWITVGARVRVVAAGNVLHGRKGSVLGRVGGYWRVDVDEPPPRLLRGYELRPVDEPSNPEEPYDPQDLSGLGADDLSDAR